ncbi:uncharacterized protein DUF4760 [Acinetobacter calcoaceticus]|uniref:Uncharacterized protein DUF4760 n=1 Tax=Acinetobacter calcoaceticus TaxID=471 RepID=A0A4V2QZW3_ACICA|nr:uncharacterized protein DUF4760 [Acinetobacter calcoaceticus]
MNIDEILILRTLVVVTPYVLLYWFFYTRIRDNFFLKPRTHIQLNLIMLSLGIAFIWTVLWNFSFRGYGFTGFYLANDVGGSSGASNLLLGLLGTLAVVLGWLFNSRAQDLTSKRSHSIQTLMSSRLSEAYANHSNYAMDVYVRLKKKNGEDYIVTPQDIEECTQLERNAIFYQLNYFEFISVGVRYGDLDENLIKNTLKSIMRTNYTFFEEVIKDKQSKNPTLYEHLTALNSRWSEK